MKFVPLALALLHLSSQSVLPSSLLVQCNDNCTCDENPTPNSEATITSVTMIKCSRDLTIELRQRDERVLVEIKCPKKKVDFSVLNGLNMNLSVANRNFIVSIEKCDLLDSTLSDLLASIGVTNVLAIFLTKCRANWQRKHFKNLKNVSSLSISQSSFRDSPVDTFEGLTNLIQLQVELSFFELTECIFRYTPNLQVVYLHKIYVSEISLDVFKHLKYLKFLKICGANHPEYNTSVILNASKEFRAPFLAELVLSSVRIPVQLREIFQNMKLKILEVTDISGANFQLQPGSFANLTTLGSVKVSGNHLQFVPEDAFSGSKNIGLMNFSNNDINDIKANTFSELEVLENLDVSRNRITHLPERLFAGTRSLKILYLSNNQLTNIEPNLFSNLRNLTGLYLSHNKLWNIRGEQFAQLKSLTVVDLSHNQLLSLLHDPLLSDLDQSVFYNCTQLRELHLQNNYLTEMYYDWRPQHSHNNLTLLDLAYNKITDIQALILTNNTVFTKEPQYEITSLEMYAKDQHKDVLIVDITNSTANFECDLDWSYKGCKQQSLDKGCPVGCRCVYREFTRSFVVTCQNSFLLVQPLTLPVAEPKRADHTELLLYGNRLREFQLPDDPGYRSVTFLNLAHNSLTSLDITGVPKRLKKLDLSHNALKTLSEDTLEVLEEALELQRLELTGNPWNCNPSNYRLAKLISDKPNLMRYKVRCADGGELSAERILYLSERDEASQHQVTIYSVSAVMLLLLISLFVLTVLYYRHRQKVHVYCYSSKWRLLRWLVSHPDLDDDKDKLYDAFIVFAQEDEEFVVDQLVPYLEETQDRKYKLCLHFRDWIPGEQILSQIGRSVRSSRRTIVVLSQHFLRSVWAVAEFRVAHAQALKDGAARVIVILLEDVPDEGVDEELEAYLQTNTYVKWGSPWFWQQLTYALPHPPGWERGVLQYLSGTQVVQTSDV